MVIPPARPDKPNREFGFVHFSERTVVEKLVADAEKGIKPTLDGNTLEVGLIAVIPFSVLFGDCAGFGVKGSGFTGFVGCNVF